jgi:transcriptional regulator with XRE-family HTH domain
MGTVAKQGASRWEPTALGRFVRRQRHELELSQEDLARRLDIHHTYVSQIERGRIPDMDARDFIDRWARALEVEPKVFVSEAELWRYNIVPLSLSELTPGQRAVLDAVSNLPEEVRHRVARGVREMYGADEPAQSPATAQEERSRTT